MPGRPSHRRASRRRLISVMLALLGLALNVAVPVFLARAALATVPDAGLFPPVCVAFPTASGGAAAADGRHCPLCFFHTCAADMAASPSFAYDPPSLPAAGMGQRRSDGTRRSPDVTATSPRGPPHRLESIRPYFQDSE